jgi:hypothetical protein
MKSFIVILHVEGLDAEDSYEGELSVESYLRGINTDADVKISRVVAVDAEVPVTPSANPPWEILGGEGRKTVARCTRCGGTDFVTNLERDGCSYCTPKPEIVEIKI